MRAIPTLVQTLVPLVVGLLVFQTLRGCWLDRYMVSSGSMEPLLHGDPETGDRVLVDKSAASWWTPERGDLVVMRNEESSDSYLIKRVIAWGGERVRLMLGDVFLWEPGRGDWRRWQKEPLEFRDMRVTFFEHPGGGEAPDPDFLRGATTAGSDLLLASGAGDLDELRALLDAAARRDRLAAWPADYHLPGHLATASAVDARFVDSQGGLRGVALPCQDIGMEIDVEPEDGLVGLQLVIEHHGEYYAWSYRTDGRVQFHIGGEPRGEPVAAAPLASRELCRIEVGYLDGRFFLIAGDRLRGVWPVELDLFGDPAFPPGQEPDNLLHVAAAGAGARIARLRVFHDVYYESLDRPFSKSDVDVPLGELWLLGDNTFDSRDSRSRGGFPRGDLVGRPVAILGPPARFRVLSR